MTKKEQIKEVAMISVILGEHFTNKLYKLVQERGQGYIETANVISDWAIAFEKKYRGTDWDKVLDEGIKPMSKEMVSVICWDDLIYDYGYFMLNKFSKT